MQTTPLLRLAYTLMAVGFGVMGWALLSRSLGAGVSTMLMAAGPICGAIRLNSLSIPASRLSWLVSCLAGFSAAAFYALVGQWVNAVAFGLMAVGFGVVGLSIPSPSVRPADEPAERRA
ncbi:hypothetical protein [Corynebacterium guangdongense]|uniref:Uncharacterized protein n=1 Tax=Corynebacterium guangdongense TaxID=1783348 RepID=A0ABU1ZXV0_9CORY|nr:hypothetical protein [Corynebacterium guangdongense]MDR7329600.1 hypothetical protein [Corynebacterium guangdongense]WJZ18165.1 hypothetical protein CGUA_08015 [Corynebacterium guangdongense]